MRKQSETNAHFEKSPSALLAEIGVRESVLMAALQAGDDAGAPRRPNPPPLASGLFRFI